MSNNDTAIVNEKNYHYVIIMIIFIIRYEHRLTYLTLT